MSKIFHKFFYFCFGIVFSFFISTIVFAQPVASFSSNITQGCTPLVVNFTDNSTGSPASWLWDFGNGNTSTVKNPGAFYTTPGVYTVKLIVTNASGSDSLIKPYYIKSFAPPKANFFSNDTLGCEPSIVNFTDISVPQSAPILSWYWNFGDGYSSALQNPTHTYSQGNFTVYLTVKDANGCSDFLFIDQYIKVNKPKASFNYQATVCPFPATVNFTNTSAGAGLNSFWDFGDGTTSSLSNPSHTYTTLDTFGVKLLITDPTGCTDSITQVVNVITFQADFGYTVSCTDTGITMNFTDKSVPAATGWRWDFGDGDTSSVQNPSHSYHDSTIQSYTIRLIANIGQGCTDTITKIYKPLVAFFSADSFYCQSPFQVNFIDQSTGTGPFTYLWDFGDGTPASSLQNPGHSYTVANGTYIDTFYVSSTVSDSMGCSYTIKDTLSIIKPFAGFYAPDTSGCIPLTVQFKDTSITRDPITNWYWDFGDGNTSVLQNPAHIYSDTGHFAVSLLITTASGCKDSLKKTNYVMSGIKPDFINSTYYDTLCFHNVYQWFDMSGFNDTAIHVNTWSWKFCYSPYYQTCCCNRGDSSVADSAMFDTGHWAFGSDTMLLAAGYNGCNDSLIMTPVTVPPISGMNHYGDATFGFCSAPVTTDVSIGSGGYDSIWVFSMKDLQTGQVTQLDPDPSVKTTLTFNKAGKYSFTVVSHNDTTKVGGCTDGNSEFLLVIDSVRNGFDMSPEISCLEDSAKGDTIAFTDSSVSFYGTIVQWFWDFGDGSSLINDTIKYTYHYVTDNYILHGYDSVFPHNLGDTVLFPMHNDSGSILGTYQNPVHIYHDTGVYIVKQTITVNVLSRCCGSALFDTLRCYYTATDTIRIHNVVAEFSANDTISCPGTVIGFFDSSTTTSSVSRWEWDFGDGSAKDSANHNPTHIYSNPGAYTVSLIMENNAGCKDTLTKNAYINIMFAVADFTPASDSVCFGIPSSFNNNSSGDGITYLWNFGDGSTDTTINPVHLYNAAGKYFVTLKVTDLNGCDSTTTDSVTVLPLPVAGFTSDTLWGICPPLPVLFADTSSSNITNWYWDFGDGNNSNLQNPSHVYTTSGNYTLTLSVTDLNGCTDSVAISNYIKLGGPFGTFGFAPDSGCVPLSVKFIANTVNAVYHFWDFGDGTLVNGGDTVSHTYIARGVFTPKLILQDSSGCTYVVPSVKQVHTDGLYAGFGFGDSLLCNTDTVFFTNLTTTFYPTGYQWSFGDGYVSTAAIPAHYYDSSGTYNITLVATDTTGCTSTATKKITVNKAPEIILAPVDTLGCIPFTVNFSAGEKDTLVKINYWGWDLGDETIVAGNSVFHTYTTAGTFNVTLKILYGDSACMIDTAMKIITKPYPLADFTFSPENPVVQSKTVSFTNLSFSALFWLWKFGSGDTSVTENPQYSYEHPGNYTVTLIVSDDAGCSDTITKEIKIIPKVPNIITPNGDGINEYFVIEGIESRHCGLQIFNRWGNLIYQSDNYQNNWNGKNFKGEQVINGVYYFILSCNYATPANGFIQIINEK